MEICQHERLEVKTDKNFEIGLPRKTSENFIRIIRVSIYVLIEMEKLQMENRY